VPVQHPIPWLLAARAPGTCFCLSPAPGPARLPASLKTASTRTKSKCSPVLGMQGKPSLGGGGASGKSTIRELRITKRVDRASTALMSALRNNEEIKQATLTIRKIGTQGLKMECLTIKIESGRLMSLEIEAGDAFNAPALLERVSFSFNRSPSITRRRVPTAIRWAAPASQTNGRRVEPWFFQKRPSGT